MDNAGFVTWLRRMLASRQSLAINVLAGFRLFGWSRRFPETTGPLSAAVDHADGQIAAVEVASLGDLLREDIAGWAPRLLELTPRHPGHVSAALDGCVRGADTNWLAGRPLEEKRLLLRLTAALPRWTYETVRLVAALGRDIPRDVLDVLAADSLRASRGGRAQAIAQGLADQTEPLLRWTLACAREPEDRRFELARTWSLAAGEPISAAARAVVEHVVRSGDDSQVEFVTTAIWQSEEFGIKEVLLTASLVDRVLTMPQEQRETCLSSLRGSVVPKVYWSNPGQPSEELVTRCAETRETAERADLSQAARDFYATATAALEQRIAESRRRIPATAPSDRGN